MPVVVVCPACQKRARVPEPMLGKTVRCPACGATFPAGADGPAPEAPAEVASEDETSPIVSSRPPLPADADVLRSLRAGVFLQLVAQGLYAAALAVFLLLALGAVLTSSPPVPGSSPFGGSVSPGRFTSTLSALASVAGLLLLGGAAACGLTGSALCTLAPVAHLARGLAIAGLAFGVLSLLESGGLVRWSSALFGLDMPVRGMAGPLPSALLANLLVPIFLAWIFETARLTVVALFWRALCFVLRDGTGALLALRLAYAIPAAHGVVFLLSLVSGLLGGFGGGGESVVVVIGLIFQIGLLVWGVLVAERVWRRLRAVVPPA